MKKHVGASLIHTNKEEKHTLILKIVADKGRNDRELKHGKT